MAEYKTQQITGYIRQYSPPADFVAFNSLYCIAVDHSGALGDDGTTTTAVLDSDASDSDDTYNGYILRLTSGDATGQQAYIYDYDGDTVTASLSPAITAPSSADTFVIFKPPEESDNLTQLDYEELLNGYNSSTSKPEAYAVWDGYGDDYIFLGGIPDNSNLVLYGLYHYMPTKLTATTDSMPYPDVFDEVIRSAVTQIAMNRDEYNTEVEMGIMSMVQQEVQMLLRYRNKEFAQSKIRGSRG